MDASTACSGAVRQSERLVALLRLALSELWLEEPSLEVAVAAVEYALSLLWGALHRPGPLSADEVAAYVDAYTAIGLHLICKGQHQACTGQHQACGGRGAEAREALGLAGLAVVRLATEKCRRAAPAVA